jgi:hypothetical protein
VTIEHGGDLVSLIFEAAGHVGAHTTDSNKCNGFFHKFLSGKGFLDKINRIEKNHQKRSGIRR